MRLNGLSLFSNVGIAEAYLKDVGIDIVLANEIDDKRARFYQEVYSDAHMICGDVTDPIVREEIVKEAKEKFGRTVWGGFDNRPGSLIYTGTKEEIEAEVKRLVEASGKRGYIIGPDCSIHDELPEERIKWIVDAARKL